MSDIEYTRNGHVALVRLNRPKALNAINPGMDQRLLECWTEINADPDIWVAVLSAEGEKAFCAGADVSGGTEAAQRVALGGADRHRWAAREAKEAFGVRRPGLCSGWRV